MAVVLHMTAEEGSRLWHGFAGQGRLCFQDGSGSKPNPTLSKCRGPDFVIERYRDFSPADSLERSANPVSLGNPAFATPVLSNNGWPFLSYPDPVQERIN